MIGNILPFFLKQDTDYLDEISKKISVIEELIEDDNSSSEVVDKINEVRNDLKDIEEIITEFENMLPKTEENEGFGNER